MIGLGTGRCGTQSLARFLHRQEGANVTHELRPILPWDAAKAPESIADRLKRLAALEPYAPNLIGDVAFYYLMYVPQILKLRPDAKFIALRRAVPATVESYVRHVYAAHGACVDHWSADRRGLRPNAWDCAYPRYDAPMRRAIEHYCVDYYGMLDEAVKAAPDNIRIWPMDALNDTAALRSMLDFVGVPPDRQVIEVFHTNKSD